MVLDYYYHLNKTQQSIYRKSDKVEKIILNQPKMLSGPLSELHKSLSSGDRKATERVTCSIVNEITTDLQVASVLTRVLSVRPSNDRGELHGIYEADDRKKAKITLWMRTAKHKRVVAYRSFLRTILHELCHHLDYELLGLKDSLHTEGFFQRESSLFNQLKP